MSAAKWVLLLLGLPIGLLLISGVYIQARKVYWDAKVRQLCEQDGGVRVDEQVEVPFEQYTKLPKVGDSVIIPSGPALKEGSPAYAVERHTVIREWDPRVIRTERTIKRGSDSKTIGKIVRYSRIGGDIPTIIFHPSSYSCPPAPKIYADQARFYQVKDR